MGVREDGGEKRREEERWEHSVQFVGSCYERTLCHITFKRLKVGRRVCSSVLRTVFVGVKGREEKSE